MRRRALKPLLLFLLVVCAAVLPVALLEAILRVGGYGYPSAFFIRVAGTPWYTTNQKFGRRFFPPVLARTPVPQRFAGAKAAGTYRIFLLGESAAMGFPQPGFSVGRQLEAMLRRAYPREHFEVIQASLTAINSHALLPVARDCAALQPDLFIVYAGNNEVVGPYGPGTAFSGFVPNLGFIRAAVWLNGTRTGQLLSAAARRVGGAGGQLAEWRGMEMFLDHAVAAGDPRMNAVYAHFARNLAGICDVARRAGAAVLLSTVPVNLRDNPPFASVHRSLPDPAKKAWKREYEAGSANAARGEHAEALRHFAAAAALDNGFADLHFRTAQSLAALGREAQALREYALARDLDALRFRADSKTNAVVREVAAAKGARAIDAEALFAARGVPGSDLFYEHVHLNFAGNYTLARMLLPETAALLRLGPATAEPGPEEIAQDLARTPWDDYRALAEIAAMMANPPFTNQLEHGAMQTALRRRVDEMREEFAAPPALEQAIRAFRTVLIRRPDDLYVRQRLADALAMRGDLDSAAAQWRYLLESLPDVDSWRVALGAVLTSRGKLEEALEQYGRVLQSDPQSAEAQFGIAAAFQRQRHFDEAVRYYRAALRLNPKYADAENNLGLICMASGDAAAAAGHYRAALRMRPEFAEAANNLAVALSALGDWGGAIEQYRRAIALRPDFPGAQANLAASLAKAGRIDESASEYRNVLAKHPDDFDAHRALAALLARSGELEGAAEHLEEAVRLRPGSAAAHYDFGSVLSRRQKLPEAIAQFTEALRLQPRYPEAWNNLGSALARQGHIERAIACFQKALECRPGFPEASGNLRAAISLRTRAARDGVR